jgi:hypothetical protein
MGMNLWGEAHVGTECELGIGEKLADLHEELDPLLRPLRAGRVARDD